MTTDQMEELEVSANGHPVADGPEDTQSIPSETPGYPLPDGVKAGHQLLKVSILDLDSGTRIRELDESHLRDLREVMEERKSPAGFDPLGAMWTTDLGRLVLYDGFHRRQSAIDVFGEDVVFPTVVQVGTLRDAIGEAFRANARAHLKLTLQQRTDIVERVLTDDYWGGWTDVKISKLTGQPRNFVRTVRKEMVKRGKIEEKETRTVERGGVQYEQKTPRGPADSAEPDEIPQAADEPSDEPGDSVEDQHEPSEKKQAVEQQYLMAIPMRANLHPDLLESFDRAALAGRALDGILNRSVRNWLTGQRAELGSEHPFYQRVREFYGTALPLVVGEDLKFRNAWTACQKCLDDQARTTGKDQAGEPCGKCKGTGIIMRAKGG